MVATMPLARVPEMAEIVAEMFAPQNLGPLREPRPQRVIMANIIDHMNCE